MNNDNIRFLAEWESPKAILMALPHEDTDWAYMLAEIHDCYCRMVTAFTDAGLKVILLCRSKQEALDALGNIPHSEHLLLLEADYNDTWTRDYGPLSVV
ncbi:MAG: agmatine deiminase family protein, partial [Muribaculaceae bacterium]|nr:agmatine deiminase family protein [Muribaculaceae bacterium]